MNRTGLTAFDSTIQKTNVWLHELMERLGLLDRHRAYLALRAVLHALRDRLPVEEAADLGAQLPLLVRGLYYEEWHPHGKPLKERKKEEFLAHIARAFQDGSQVNPERVARAVFQVLARHVTPGEIEDIKNSLPADIRALWSCDRNEPH
jgi:uncharacterized protein (DUF2267 family)